MDPKDSFAIYPARGRTARTVVHLLVAGCLLGLAVACVPPSPPDDAPGVTVEMDATVSPVDPDFYSLPWPNSIRKTADGHLDLLRYPGTTSLELTYLASSVGSTLEGFGTQTAVYMRFTGAIDVSTLPSAAESVLADSTVQLVERDHPERRIPVVARIEPADSFRGPNLLSLLPYPGHTLQPDTDYIALVTNGVKSSGGDPLRPARLIGELDGADWLLRARSASDWSDLLGQRDAARAALAAGGAWAPGDLVAFSGFRTQDSTADARAVDAAIERLAFPAPVLTVPTCTPGARTVTASGTVSLPLFQAGEYPFRLGGGRIVVDDGVAVVQAWQQLPIALRIPCGEVPEGGWPIQTFINGSGGGVEVDRAIGVSDLAIMGSVPPLYGVGSPFVDTMEDTYYNLYNPPAARGNQVQQVAHNLALIKVLRELDLDGAALGSSTTITTNDTAITISGQSQGAQTLPLVAWAEPEVDAAIAGAGSAGFYNQISYCTEFRTKLSELTGRIEEYDTRNPIPQLVSMLLDSAEPANFPNDVNYLNFSGEDDGCVPLESARHFAAVQDLALVGARLPSVFGEESLEPPRLPAPVSANVGGRTRVSLELPGGHGNAYVNEPLSTAFAEAALGGEAPVVDGPFNSTDWNCLEPRYGPFGG